MKRLTRTLVSMLALITVALPLSSCDKVKDIFEEEHEHTWKYYIAKQPTCTQNGIMEKLCEECGEKIYEDITSTGHNFINGVCTVCGQEGEDENALVHIPLPEGSNNTAKWSPEDMYKEATELVKDYDDYTYEVGYAQFLKNLSCGYIQDVYLDTLQLLHFNISWTTVKNENLEAPFIWTVGKVSPINTTDKKLATVYRVEIKDEQLCITYSDGVQTSAGSFTAPVDNQPMVTAFGINPDNELVIYYEDNTIAFAGVVAQGETAENQAPFSYTQTANGYEVNSAMDKNATHLEIPLTHRGKPITSIDNMAFYNLDKLKSVKVGANVTTIGNDIFAKCTALQWVVIPESITSLNYGSLVSQNSAHFFFEQNRPNTTFNSAIAPYLHFKGEWSYVNGIPTVS